MQHRGVVFELLCAVSKVANLPVAAWSLHLEASTSLVCTANGVREPRGLAQTHHKVCMFLWPPVNLLTPPTFPAPSTFSLISSLPSPLS